MHHTVNKSLTKIEQDNINQTEWNNPDNWAGPRWISIYFSKKDTRTFVPKQVTWMGWTLNLGNVVGLYCLLGLFAALLLLIMFA